MNCQHLINTGDFPIADLDSSVRSAVIDRVRSDLESDGCALLKGFLSEQGLHRILSEAEERRESAYFSEHNKTTAYLTDQDPSFDQNHPVNHLLDRTNGFIRSDEFGKETASFQLYNWLPLNQFLADCLGKEKLYIYADPVSNMIVNVCSPGTQFNWHFDTNEFTITMLLKPAEEGGYFEYAPNIRSAENECYDAVSEVLHGDRKKVKRLDLMPGDLQLFLGRYSLHQVTKNTGNEDRLLIIMSFTEEPNLIGSKQRVEQLYGKLTDAHFKEKRRNDNLRD